MLQDIKLKVPSLSGEIWIAPEVQKLLMSYRQTEATSTEAGGVLIGYRRGPHIDNIEGSAPMAADIRKRHSFERKDNGHQDLCDTRWEESGGFVTYLGEWHTHPSMLPSPSYVDRVEWGKLSKIYTKPLLFIIVGIEHYYIEVNKFGFVMPMQRMTNNA